MKKLNILYILILIYHLAIASNQELISNGSFENHLLATFDGGASVKDNVEFWEEEATPGTSDYFNPFCTNPNFGVPNNITGYLDAHTGNSYVGIATYQNDVATVSEYIRTKVELVQGRSYDFQMYVNLASTCKYNTRLGFDLVQNFSAFSSNQLLPFNTNSSSVHFTWPDKVVTDPQQWVLKTISFIAPTTGTYDLIIGYFDTFHDAAVNDSSNSSPALEKLAYYLIDDVSITESILPIPCCPYTACYTNTSQLPPTTVVTGYIKAGNAESCLDGITPGTVTVTSNQNVVFNAGDFIEIGNQEIAPNVYSNIAGMNIEQGAFFEAKIEGCNSTNSANVPDVHIVQVDNIYVRGTGTFYSAIVENATSYIIQVQNRWGTTVHLATGTVISNYIPLWDGHCDQGDCSDGNYIVYLTFLNCNSSVSLDPFWVLVGTANARHSNQSAQNQPAPSDSIIPGNNNIKSPVADHSLSIFPNPVENDFTVISSKTFKKVTMFDASGELIYSSSYSDVNNCKIDMSIYGKGYYLLEIVDSQNNSVYQKLIKS